MREEGLYYPTHLSHKGHRHGSPVQTARWTTAHVFPLPRHRSDYRITETDVYLHPPRKQKLKFTYKEQREFETIDDDIAALEELLEKLDKDMEANATNSVKLREIMEQKEKAQADLDEKMDRWVYLNDLAERIEAQKSEK